MTKKEIFFNQRIYSSLDNGDANLPTSQLGEYSSWSWSHANNYRLRTLTVRHQKNAGSPKNKLKLKIKMHLLGNLNKVPQGM